MSLVLSGSTSGSVTLQEPAVAGTTVLDLPATSGNVVVDTATQTLTNKSIAATQLTGTIAAARLPTGSVLQVVSTVKTDTFSTTSDTWIDITGLSVNITPTSASNKILIIANYTGSNQSGYSWGRLVRGSTPICIADAAGSRQQATTANFYQPNVDRNFTGSVCFLDSPATTSATTYKIQLIVQAGGYTTYINRTNGDTDSAAYARFTSQITVMEIAA
jgi:hypothetical protein